MTTGIYAFDAYSPSEVARRVETLGVAKARMALLPLAMLGVLAGAFIGLGSMLFVIVRADASLGLAASQLGAGLAFSLGLLLVVVAGAELFTGNNLLAMAWADGRITSVEVLRNWALVCAANFAGAAGMALLVYLSGHTAMGGDAVARTVVRIALAKQHLPVQEAFFRGMLCNVLVCMAVWMAMAGRSITDKAVAVVFPVTAFVAAGFEHSIARNWQRRWVMACSSATSIVPRHPSTSLDMHQGGSADAGRHFNLPHTFRSNTCTSASSFRWTAAPPPTRP